MERGFSLVELMAVILVLAILAGIGIPAMGGYRDRAAARVNEVNLLTTRRQMESVRQVWPGEIESWLYDEILSQEGVFTVGSWRFTAPGALGVSSGDAQVAEGTPMRAKLLPEGVVTAYEEISGGVVPETTAPPETEPPDPTVPWHVCRDKDQNCRCDTPGCETPLHIEEDWTGSGSCKTCGTHFVHYFSVAGICTGCRLEEATGQIHVCAWPEGGCLCRCGANRCHHPATIGKCAICGNRNSVMDPCPNCSTLPASIP